ncbi:MAG: DEAD/DEAH box helicase family protein, partial [Bacteroidales bacterium]|nr:DEAD/DEAH box helicase family protein [Bacteroidales bacterium]
MNDNLKVLQIREELKSIEKQKRALLEELKELEHSSNFLGIVASPETVLSPQDKVALFLRLFRTRSDVYAHFWENKKSGRTGYSPVCSNEWIDGVCFKPKTKCVDCTHQAFVPFDEKTAISHLTGKSLIGSYAINSDDMCSFLAADFDKSDWKEDALCYKEVGIELGVDVAIEISKSGNGAHCWIFFHERVSARDARLLGSILLAKAQEANGTYTLESYDRFFPNQDYIPKGGFGNLIALPLQKRYRDNNSLVFVDSFFSPFSDQWEYLSHVHLLNGEDLDNSLLIEHIVHAAIPALTTTISINQSIIEHKTHIPTCSGTIEIIISGQIAIPLSLLPSKVLIELKKIATIANPTFFQHQKMRMSTWNIPRYIFCGDHDNEYLFLPRGLLDKVSDTLTSAGFTVKHVYQRNENPLLNLTFRGKLYDYQTKALEEIVQWDEGVLLAPTGTGKTIIAIALIVKRSLRTLIVVHVSTLIEQWIHSLITYIPELKRKDIGVLGKGR